MRFISKTTLLTGVISLCSLNLAAATCPRATASSSLDFCSSFAVAAECHCQASGLRRDMCLNHDVLYKRMIITFGSLQRACEFQHDTTAQECIDDWNCFRNGGVTSDNQLCSGTGKAC